MPRLGFFALYNRAIFVAEIVCLILHMYILMFINIIKLVYKQLKWRYEDVFRPLTTKVSITAYRCHWDVAGHPFSLHPFFSDSNTDTIINRKTDWKNCRDL